MLVGSVSASARLNDDRSDRIKDKIRRTEAELQTLTARDTGIFKDTAQDEVVPYDQMRTALDPNEALVTFATSVDTTFVFVATRDRLKWFRSTLNIHDLQQMVTILRCGVDAERWVGESQLFCRQATNADNLGGNLPFNLAVAHQLYQELLSPAEDGIAGT
jgi:hypothetical protein